MRYFISDTHFGHARIIELCNRPFSDYTEMDWKIVDNWNSTVGPDDEVFHLGDVALGPWVRWHDILTGLNGFKTLVVGNHDRVFEGGSTKEQERFYPYYSEWFDVVTNEVKNFVLSDGTRVNMSHFPYDGDSHDGDRYEDFRLPDEGKVLIHGHTHRDSKVSRSKNGTLQIHVGADAWGYRPVSEEEVLNLIRQNS